MPGTSGASRPAAMPTPRMRTSAGRRAMSDTSGCMKKYATSEVEDRRDPEEEREAAHRADREEVEDERRRSATRGRRRRSCGTTGEPAVDRRRAPSRPVRTSSFSRSKYTTYESTVTPTDTMRPVTPASVSVSPIDVPEVRDQRVDQRRAHEEPGDHDRPEQPVVDEHVERDEQQADQARRDPGVELVAARASATRSGP